MAYQPLKDWEGGIYEDGTPPPRKSRRKLIWIAAVVVLLAIIGAVVGGVVGSKSKSSEAKPAEPSKPARSTPRQNTALAVASTLVKLENSVSYNDFVLIYQTDNGELYYSYMKTDDPKSVPAPLGSAYKAATNTPLAVNTGASTRREIHLYYIDDKGYVAEAIFSSGTNTWAAGKLSAAGVRPLAGSQLSAGVWSPGSSEERNALFYQAETSYVEYVTSPADGRWARFLGRPSSCTSSTARRCRSGR